MFEVQIGKYYKIKVNAIKEDYLRRQFKEGKTYVVQAVCWQPNKDWSEQTMSFVLSNGKGFTQISKFSADIEVLKEIKRGII